MFKKVCWSQQLLILMISGLFIISVTSILSGCGNRGDLYLPDTSSKTETTPKNQNKTPVEKKS